MGILINKPRISQKTQISMSDKNHEIAALWSQIRQNVTQKQAYGVHKIIKQVQRKNIEWIDVEKMCLDKENNGNFNNVEMETNLIIKRFECKPTCESSDESFNSLISDADEHFPGAIQTENFMATCETEINEYKIKNNVSPKMLCRQKTIDSIEKMPPRYSKTILKHK